MQDKLKEHRRKMAEVIARASTDESFREKLLSDPRAVLEAHGITLPAGLEVKVLKQTDKLKYVVIPFKPANSEGGSWMCEDDCYDLPCVRCS